MSQVATTAASCPVQIWMPVISAFLGAGVAFLGVSLTNKTQKRNLELQIKHQEKSDSRVARRDKLEELYVLELGLYDLMSQKFSMLTNAVKSQLPHEVLLKLMAPLNSIDDPIPRMQVLVHLYFDNIFPSFQRLAKRITAFRQIEFQIHQTYREGKIPAIDVVKDLDAEYSAIAEKIHVFRGEIISCGDPVYKSNNS